MVAVTPRTKTLNYRFYLNRVVIWCKDTYYLLDLQ